MKDGRAQQHETEIEQRMKPPRGKEPSDTSDGTIYRYAPSGSEFPNVTAF